MHQQEVQEGMPFITQNFTAVATNTMKICSCMADNTDLVLLTHSHRGEAVAGSIGTLLKDASIEDGDIKTAPDCNVTLEGCFLRCITLDIALYCSGIPSLPLDGLYLHSRWASALSHKAVLGMLHGLNATVCVQQRRAGLDVYDRERSRYRTYHFFCCSHIDIHHLEDREIGRLVMPNSLG